MKEYETVFITQPGIADSDRKTLDERIGSTITKHNGKIFFSKDMGRKDLAYSIRKFRKGIYTCLDYTAEGKAVNELERMMRMNEDVLRFLTIVKNDSVDVEARLAEVAARGEDQSEPAAEKAEKTEKTPTAGKDEDKAEKKDSENSKKEEA